MAELPTHILTDAGFTTDEADAIVKALVAGDNLHGDTNAAEPINIDDLPPEKKEALDRFNLAVAADA
ncbi:hypothetical protein OG767_14495 [Micromonospora sp. NBC_01392]|uniref:hypothetical protein n=1 Tax=Micromonospora sp. NBC_01392 TaxID=2903588 RepID=UPI0032477945